MVFQSLVIDAGAQEIRAAGNYKDEEGLDLKLETLDKSYELKGPFPRPILKSIASAPLPAPLGACVSASPGEASAP